MPVTLTWHRLSKSTPDWLLNSETATATESLSKRYWRKPVPVSNQTLHFSKLHVNQSFSKCSTEPPREDFRRLGKFWHIEEFPGPSSQCEQASCCIRLELQKRCDSPHSGGKCLPEGRFERLTEGSMANHLATELSWHLKKSLSFLGGHINPAVSLAMAVCGRLKWSSLPFYMLAQFVGAFIACAGVFAVYHGRLKISSLQNFHFLI